MALLLLLGRWLAALYTDLLWFDSLGARAVWETRIATTVLLGGATFVIAGLFAAANFYAVRHSVVSLVLPRRVGNLEIGEEVPGRYLTIAVALLAAAVGAILTLPSAGWHQAFLARRGRSFGESDPYFGTDLGFFVYRLPFETRLHLWAVIVLASVTGLVVLLYALTPSLRWDRGHVHISAYVRRHLTILGAVLMLLVAWSDRLAMYRLLAVGGGTGHAFSAIDHRVGVPVLLLLALLTLCASLVVAWAGWTGQPRLAFLAVTSVLAAALLGRGVAPFIARRTSDRATTAMDDRAYRATRLAYTRRAFGVDRIRPESLGAGLASLGDAATHVAVWDAVTLARAAERQRRVRVVGETAGWLRADAGIHALLVEHTADPTLAARDVWGIARFDAASADERGAPVRVNARTRGGDELVFDEPAVYDSAPRYSVLSDSLRRLAGVEMSTTRSRFFHAWSLQNFRLLIGELPADRPTMVRFRSVRDRVRELAPWFVQGSDVTPVVADDSLYWTLDLYVASSSYPLSERFTILGEERGYLQHAATAVLHAASGRVRLLADANPDPIAATWMAAFPTLFIRSTALSPALRGALQPASDAGYTQALAFAAAGFRGDSLEVRHFAVPDGGDSASTREPGRASLPGSGVNFLWPLLDGQDRVRGIIAAAGGGDRATSWIPLMADGAHWGGVVDRLRAADTLGRENAIVRSPVRVSPVGGRPLYVQPAYRWRPGGSPSLVRIATLFGDTVRSALTLGDAIGAAPTPAIRPVALPGIRERAESLYRTMREALGRGDWAGFGRAMDALGVTLRSSP